MRKTVKKKKDTEQRNSRIFTDYRQEMTSQNRSPVTENCQTLLSLSFPCKILGILT